ncbi:unnamed protein product [Strongylus vulgaris]|uniref:Ribosomal protein eL8/eL30/eS12/Gadd45 domain-containing protein n=1 Tax=Strongylus vulgaris TaxID=40348 RepID=A0A3P7IBA5_STRVU|nr:unnamed protein product [Strongylus vulgaris]
MGKRNADESLADASMNESAIVDGPSTAKEEYEYLCTLVRLVLVGMYSLQVNAISKPLANRKLAKKLYKLVKKSAKQPHHLRQGLKDVQKALRKNEKGIAVLAGNVSPIDVYSHIPALCEELEIPYVFTPSREQLGLAAGHRRPAILLLIRPHPDYQELYDEVDLTYLLI